MLADRSSSFLFCTARLAPVGSIKFVIVIGYHRTHRSLYDSFSSQGPNQKWFGMLYVFGVHVRNTFHDHPSKNPRISVLATSISNPTSSPRHGVASAHARGKNAASRGAKGSKDKSRRPEAGHVMVCCMVKDDH